MKFERRIYFGFIVIVLSFLPVVIGSFVSVREIVNEENSIISVNARSMVLAERLRYIGSAQSALMPVFVLTGDPSLIQIFEKQNKEFREINLLLNQLETNVTNKLLISKVLETSDRAYSYTNPGIKLRQNGASVAKVNQYFQNEAAPNFRNLISRLDELVSKESESLKSAKLKVASSVNWVTNALAFLVFLALALVVLIIWLTSKVMKQKKVYDQTQKILMEQEKEISQARKETVEVVSHDLKNPLSAIKMSLEMMLDGVPETQSAPEFKEGLKIAMRATETMEHLIRDLLDHAKIESGHLVLEKSACDFGSLVKDLLKSFEPLARKKQITLIVNIKEQIATECDIGRIEQALSNLVGNALKFTQNKGHIHVDVEVNNKNILVSVEDSGSGIEKAQLPHVFDRFWQVGKTARHGTGLGLAIAKAIVDAHQGRIWAESEFGKGSKFCFALPLISASNPYISSNTEEQGPIELH